MRATGAKPIGFLLFAAFAVGACLLFAFFQKDMNYEKLIEAGIPKGIAQRLFAFSSSFISLLGGVFLALLIGVGSAVESRKDELVLSMPIERHKIALLFMLNSSTLALFLGLMLSAPGIVSLAMVKGKPVFVGFVAGLLFVLVVCGLALIFAVSARKTLSRVPRRYLEVVMVVLAIAATLPLMLPFLAGSLIRRNVESAMRISRVFEWAFLTGYIPNALAVRFSFGDGVAGLWLAGEVFALLTLSVFALHFYEFESAPFYGAKPKPRGWGRWLLPRRVAKELLDARRRGAAGVLSMMVAMFAVTFVVMSVSGGDEGAPRFILPFMMVFVMEQASETLDFSLISESEQWPLLLSFPMQMREAALFKVVASLLIAAVASLAVLVPGTVLLKTLKMFVFLAFGFLLVLWSSFKKLSDFFASPADYERRTRRFGKAFSGLIVFFTVVLPSLLALELFMFDRDALAHLIGKVGLKGVLWETLVGLVLPFTVLGVALWLSYRRLERGLKRVAFWER